MKVLLLLLLAPVVAVAQDCTYSLKGIVLDNQGGALPGAAVHFRDATRGTVTDLHGEFTLSALCEGSYELHVQYMGFDEATVSVQVPQSGLIKVRLSESSTLLETIVVESQKSNIGETQTAAKISGEALFENRGKTLGETLRKLPGVTSLQTGPTIFKPVINGLHSNRILILNNGIRQEGQQWGVDHSPEIDPFIASELTVIKDAGAIKYGPDALGGVVLVTPAELPSESKLGGEFNLVGMTNGRAGTASGLLEGGLKNAWGWRVHGTAKRAGDFHAADYNLSNTGMQEFNYSATLGYHKKDMGMEVYYSHFFTRLGILRGSSLGSEEDLKQALEQEPPQYTQPFTYKITTPNQEARHDLVKVNGHYHLSEQRSIRLQYGLQINRRKEFDVRRGNLNEIPSINLQLFTHTLDVEYEYSHRDKFYGSVGANGMFQDNQNIPGTLRIPFVPNFTQQSGGIFIINRWHLQKVALETGLRFDQRHYDVAGRDYKNELFHSALDFGNFSGTTGVRLPMNKSWKFNSTLGLAWRPPHVAELYSFGRHQSVGAIEYGLLLDKENNSIIPASQGNALPEKSLKWNNSFTFKKNKFEAEVTAFADLIFNYINLRPGGITTAFTGPTPYFRYTQNDALFAGVDFFGTCDLSTKFSINGKASWLRAKDIENNDYFLFIPSNRFELEATYRAPRTKGFPGVYVSLNARYVAEQKHGPRVIPIDAFLDNSTSNPVGTDLRNFDFLPAPPGYFLAGMQMGVSKAFKDSKLDFRVEVTNLFNQAYREYTNRMRYFADDLGRNLTLGLKYSF